MPEAPNVALLVEPVEPWIPDVRLLVEMPSRREVFFSNLRDLLSPAALPDLRLQSAPAPFWHDVFVRRGLPWRRFAESSGYHLLAAALLIIASRYLPSTPQPAPRPAFDHEQVIYYQPAEYLPPIDTRRPETAPPQKSEPEVSAQPIISLPREADNRNQTIVTPPDIKLKRDVPLPNVVAWSDKPQLPIAPAPVVPASKIERIAPQIENSVVAPPPDPSQMNLRREATMMQTAVVAPPPSLDIVAARGEVNIAPTAVIAPAPQLAVRPQRTALTPVSGVAGAPQVVPPPPSVSSSGSSAAGGRVIALNLHPNVAAPPDPPAGNRRGSFAVTPEGHAGASGTPGADGAGSASGSGNGAAPSADLPSGLYVGKAAGQPAAKTGPTVGDPAAKGSTPANSALAANVPPPRVAATPGRPARPESRLNLSEPERQVFADRNIYSLTLNMPNLNSAGGTWVVRFAEKKDGSAPGELSSPAATRKVDPAYPLELMRQNVSGTVVLYAIIRADGTVGDVRVLRSVDDRLDHFAADAVAQWHFQPATKNGSPVDVEATFHIPFRPVRSNF